MPNLKDRRNQRKVESTEDGQSEKVNEEIDKIKEEAFMITNQQSHFDRKQSRARAFSKKIEQERGQSNGSHGNQMAGMSGDGSNRNAQFDSRYGISNMKDLVEDDNEDSPRLHRTADIKQIGDSSEDYSYGQDGASCQEETDQQVSAHHQLNEEIRNRWTHEELAFIDNYGQALIGCECFEGKIILVFDDFTIREILLETLEELQSTNLIQRNGINESLEKAVDFAVDKELQAIAITTTTTVYIFDFDYLF